MTERIAPVLANFALGLWGLMNPILFVYFQVATPTWNHVLVGAAVIAMAIARGWRGAAPWASWVNVALGLWLAVSPWVLGYAYTDAYAMPGLIAGNDVVAGLAIALTAVLSTMVVRRHPRGLGAQFAAAMPDERGRPEHDTLNERPERKDRFTDR
jgi:hypothetical protein